MTGAHEEPQEIRPSKGATRARGYVMASVICTHSHGWDAPEETVYSLPVKVPGLPARGIDRVVAFLASLDGSRWVRGGHARPTPGTVEGIEKLARDPSTSRQYQLRCDVCGMTGRVPHDELVRALQLLAGNGVYRLPLKGIEARLKSFNQQ